MAILAWLSSGNTTCVRFMATRRSKVKWLPKAEWLESKAPVLAQRRFEKWYLARWTRVHRMGEAMAAIYQLELDSINASTMAWAKTIGALRREQATLSGPEWAECACRIRAVETEYAEQGKGWGTAMRAWVKVTLANPGRRQLDYVLTREIEWDGLHDADLVAEIGLDGLKDELQLLMLQEIAACYSKETGENLPDGEQRRIDRLKKRLS